MQCAAVKKRGSQDQCPAMSLRGHTLCGRHVRATTPTLWASAMGVRSPRVVKLQALVRGWLVRCRLRLAGPGVLSRRDLANDEELVSCESKDRQHPFDYFAFEENGKVWWFEFASLWRWASQSHEPENPYTKVPLSQTTRRRLRAAWAYRQRRRLPLPSESSVYEQRLRARWNLITQLFLDNGFVDVHPNNFTRLNASELRTMFVFLERDIQVVFSDKDPGKARALRLCRRGLHANPELPPTMYVLGSAYILLLILTVHRDSYNMTFNVLSALYRC